MCSTPVHMSVVQVPLQKRSEDHYCLEVRDGSCACGLVWRHNGAVVRDLNIEALRTCGRLLRDTSARMATDSVSF